MSASASMLRWRLVRVGDTVAVVVAWPPIYGGGAENHQIEHFRRIADSFASEHLSELESMYNEVYATEEEADKSQKIAQKLAATLTTKIRRGEFVVLKAERGNAAGATRLLAEHNGAHTLVGTNTPTAAAVQGVMLTEADLAAAKLFRVHADATTQGLDARVANLVGAGDPAIKRAMLARVMYEKSQLNVRGHNTTHNARKRGAAHLEFDPSGGVTKPWERDVTADAPGVHIRELESIVKAAAAGLCPVASMPDELHIIMTDSSTAATVIARPPVAGCAFLWSTLGVVEQSPSLDQYIDRTSVDNEDIDAWVVYIDFRGSRHAVSRKRRYTAVTAELGRPEFEFAKGYRYVYTPGDAVAEAEAVDPFVLVTAAPAEVLWRWGGPDGGGSGPDNGEASIYTRVGSRWENTATGCTLSMACPVFATINREVVPLPVTESNGIAIINQPVDANHLFPGLGVSADLFQKCDGSVGPDCGHTRGRLLSATPFQDAGCADPAFRDHVLRQFKTHAHGGVMDELFFEECYHLTQSSNPSAVACAANVIQLSDGVTRWCVGGGGVVAEDAISATVAAIAPYTHT